MKKWNKLKYDTFHKHIVQGIDYYRNNNEKSHYEKKHLPKKIELLQSFLTYIESTTINEKQFQLIYKHLNGNITVLENMLKAALREKRDEMECLVHELRKISLLLSQIRWK